MEKQYVFYITIEGKKIKCIVTKKKIKGLYMTVKNQELHIRMPLRLNMEYVYEFITKKKEWICKALNRENRKENKEINLKDRDYIFILGNKVKVKYVKWDKSEIETVINTNQCIVYLPEFEINSYNKIQNSIEEKLKEIIKEYVYNAINKYSMLTGLKPKEVVIKKYKSVWGKCSSTGVISINQNLIWFSKKEIEYVCLHEIVHLKYMNHQKEFWKYLSKYMPDYKESVKKLHS